MRRRQFIAALGAAAAWPLGARAEQRIPRIGYLSPRSAADPLNQAYRGAFEAGLRDFGYTPGKTIEIEYRFGDEREERMRELAREFVDSNVDVIVTFGLGVFASHSVTNAVPIVSAVGPDLVEVGFAESLSHPGGNVTGQTFFFYELTVKRIALLKQVTPAMTRVGVLVARPLFRVQDYIRVPTEELGVEPEAIEVAEPGDCDRALSEAPTIEGLAVPDLPQFTNGGGPAVIAAAAARRGLPAAGGLSFARNGGLLSFGVDMVSMTRRAAVFVDKILKGARPGDIPIEQATKFTTIVNLKTAKALGVEIPPAVLAAADEVIE